MGGLIVRGGLSMRVLMCLITFVIRSWADGMEEAPLKHFKFEIQYLNVERLCNAKRIVAVNGHFPGPTVCVREGDRVMVDVHNALRDKNITIHWHGVRQLRSCWSDGPAYLTQCPIQPGGSFTHDFTVTGQRGTLLWHAHLSWLRATVYGAFIILPRLGLPYPFAKPDVEANIILGEWWKADVEKVIQQALQSGAAPAVSDAYTINGQPGLLYPCSAADVFVLPVAVPGQTFLLRIINAALNTELFFAIAHHNMTVVEVDAVYTKLLPTPLISIAPGQTTTVLITADDPAGQLGSYIMAAGPHVTAANISFDSSTATAILRYSNTSSAPPMGASLPAFNDSTFATKFSTSLRSLNSIEYPAIVPNNVQRDLFYTIGLARKACPPGQVCQSGGKLAASVNNISFVLPTSTSILQAYYFGMQGGVFTTDFPDNPPSPFNYTGTQPANLQPQLGTRLTKVPFGTHVQLILQDTSILGTESHPIHVHGYNFHIVGQGLGNYDAHRHPLSFNLVDPQERNTFSVPAGGWAALRFTADNPGVWLLHCHLDVHTTWGLDMAFLVEDGVGPNESLPPPPPDLPSC